MDLLMGGGVPLLSLIASIFDYVVIIFLAVVIGRGDTHASPWMWKTVILLYGTLALLTAASRFLVQLDGPTFEFVINTAALSIRLGLLVLMTAWAWDELETRLEKRRHAKTQA